MRRMLKRLAPGLSALLLLGGCAAPSAPAEGGVVVSKSLAGRELLLGTIPCAFPLSAAPQSMNVLSVGYGGVDQEDVYVWQKYEEMTGVDVRWTTVLRAERAERGSAALTNGQALDLIMRCKILPTRLTQYGESGLILDLAKDDLLQTYAPNCWAYLSSHPETLASVMDPDGAIYSLPQVNAGPELRVSVKLFVNRTWLENVGMELPATTEEFYALLKAFKEQDANGNGDADDEIPFCCPTWQGVQESLAGAFGLENRGTHNLTVDCDEETGRVRLIAGCEPYRDFLTYVRRLYGEGLLDPATFTISEAQWRGNAARDKIGVFTSTNLAWVPAGQTENWVAIGEALEGPSGDKLWAPIRANFHSAGAAVIPSTCKDPALALRWLDYFWTDEGTLFYHMGVEGETFGVNGDGAYDYLPAIYEEMRAGNKAFDDVIAAYSPYPGGSNPLVEIAPYFMGGEMAPVPAEAARSLFAYGPKTYWPSFTFTTEENERLSAIRTDIEKYCETMRVKFITGETPLTAWDAYLA